MTISTTRKLLPLLPLLLAACSGGNNENQSGPGDATGDILFADLPADDLSSFSATLTEVRLRRDGGSTTDDLLPGTLQVELLGLGGAFRWLASAELESDSYTGLEIEFEPFGYSARDLSGAPVTVDSLADTLSITFAGPLVVEDDDYVRFEVDLDLDNSLSGDVSSGTVLFDPNGTVLSSSGDDSTAIDEIQGVVQSLDAAANRLVLNAFADGDLSVPLGDVQVVVEAGAMLLRDDGGLFADADAFFAALQVEQTRLEVHGQLQAGEVRAHRIEIEDHAGVSGGEGLVRIEGRILELDPGVGFALQIIELEKGLATAAPVLAGLGNPGSIEVALTQGTTFVEDDGTPSDADALAVGQEVKVRFAAFVGEPFPAARVELEDAQPEFEGTLVDVSALPDRVTMHLRASSPAITAGLVASTSTDVVVELNGASLLVDAGSEPALTPSALLNGMEVKVRGTLSGDASSPSIDSSRLVVRAGRLDDATVVTSDAGNFAFETMGGEIDDPFGGGLSAGPLRIVLDDDVEIDGDASASNFFQVLAEEELVEVRVEGIASGEPNEIRAFEIDVRVESD